MARTTLSDGGYVDSFVDSHSQAHAQKYTSGGAAVGPEWVHSTQASAVDVVALNNGGYVIDSTEPQIGSSILAGYVFDAGGGQINTFQDNIGSARVVASPDGGFLVETNTSGWHGAAVEPTLQFFSNSGAQLIAAPLSGAALPAISVLANGDYQLSWTDDASVSHTLVVDPRNPPDLSRPAAPQVTGMDDAGPATGPFSSGATTDDTTPTLRVTVTQAGAIDVFTRPPGENLGQPQAAHYDITAEDIARGYKDVPASPNAIGDGGYTAHVYITSPNGVVSPETKLDFAVHTEPGGSTPGNGHVIDAHQTPDTLTGGSGDDTLNASQGPDELTGGDGHDAFVFHQEPWAPARITDFAVGTDRLDLAALFQKTGYTGSDPVADGYIKLLDDGHGGTEVFFDPDGPNPAHQWADNIIDLQHVPVGSATWSQIAGNTPSSPPSPPPVSPPPSSGGTVQMGHDGGSNLAGGSGDDTLIGGTSGPDTMTGGGGGDHFEFDKVSWQAATITDFTHGVDKIDMSHLLASVGYAGSDPIADGYVKFGDDGQGNTWIYFDKDGAAGTADQWGTKVATLSHVSAASLTPSDWIFQSGGGSPPPPPPPPPPPGGQVFTAHDGGTNLVGTSGDDTLVGAHGQDTMTGGGGGDHFTWNELPWAYAQITDFTHGSDHIDVSHLLANAGYAGSDPIADGYIKFGDDGQGNTWVYFDKDGSAGTADPWGTHLATLQHVSASSLSGSDFIFH